MIPVSKPYMPSLDRINKRLEQVQNNAWLTNFGPLHNELEYKLKDYLGVKYLLPMANGTIALQVAIELLGFKGKKVITTAFSFIATASSLIWQGVEPVFVDIDPKTLTINVDEIEKALNKYDDIAGILPVHVYGWPCDVVAIDALAKKFDVKVLYDAAPAFGTKVNGSSVLNYGDLSVLSFHATKLFNTVEGGALVCHTKEMYDKAKRIINFGVDRSVGNIIECGINGKMSEFHAAVGLCVLEDVEQIIISRKSIVNFYRKNIDKKYQIAFKDDAVDWNHAYFPILFESYDAAESYLKEMKKKAIIPKRYYEYSLQDIGYMKGCERLCCSISSDASKRVVCLPLYSGLPEHIARDITSSININSLV